jgi:hypothetical protein
MSRYPVDMSVMTNASGNEIPAMPDDPFEHLPVLRTLLTLMSPHTSAGMNRHTSSLLSTLEVTNVPPKPHHSKVAKREHKEALINHHDSLSNLFPDTIIPQNIGSNKSLLRMLRDHYETQQQHLPGQCSTYSVFNTDIDIFDRQLKV